MLIWITGLPGSGKTTLANKIRENLEMQSIATVNLDGDYIRSILPNKIEYSIEERKRLSNFYANLGAKIESPRIVVICSFVALFSLARKIAKARWGTDFYQQLGWGSKDQKFVEGDQASTSDQACGERTTTAPLWAINSQEL